MTAIRRCMLRTAMGVGLAVAVLQLSAGPPQAVLTAAVTSTASTHTHVAYANSAAEAAARAAYQAGFRDGNGLIFIVAIAGAESSWNPSAYNGSCCYGLWQINAAAHPSCHNLLNADANADCAELLYDNSKYAPWDCDKEVSCSGTPSTTADLAACGGVCYNIAKAAVEADGYA